MLASPTRASHIPTPQIQRTTTAPSFASNHHPLLPSRWDINAMLASPTPATHPNTANLNDDDRTFLRIKLSSSPTIPVVYQRHAGVSHAGDPSQHLTSKGRPPYPPSPRTIIFAYGPGGV
jgi:hypothetical protein